MPGRRSEILWTPSANVAVRNAGRGSRPGFSNSARMSATVGNPNRSSTKSLGAKRLQLRRVADERADVGLRPGQDAPHHRVGLRVHAGDVERVVAAADAQEARALLERLRAEARHVGERGARAERAVGVPVRDDLRGERLGDARHPPQQRRRRRVDVDADGVDAVLHHRVERAGQRRLRQVVLVLPDADRLGVDLDELRERILQATGDGDRAAQRHVEAGQLRRGVRGRRVDRRACLAHDDRHEPERGVARGELASELFGLP